MELETVLFWHEVSFWHTPLSSQVAHWFFRGFWLNIRIIQFLFGRIFMSFCLFPSWLYKTLLFLLFYATGQHWNISGNIYSTVS